MSGLTSSFLFRSSSLLPLLVVALILLLLACLGFYSRPAGGFLLFCRLRGGGWRRRGHIFPDVVTLRFVRVVGGGWRRRRRRRRRWLRVSGGSRGSSSSRSNSHFDPGCRALSSSFRRFFVPSLPRTFDIICQDSSVPVADRYCERHARKSLFDVKRDKPGGSESVENSLGLNSLHRPPQHLRNVLLGERRLSRRR